MTNEQIDMNDNEQSDADVLASLADLIGDDDALYQEIERRLPPSQPVEPEAEHKPPENRPGWMDFDSRVGVGLTDDEQKRAEQAQRQETDDRETAILNAIQDGDRDKAARIGGKRASYSNLQE